jgi:exopolysaccharide production protein ExoQ
MTQIATIVYALLILALFALDRDRKSRTSIALWIPVIWMLIAASRPVSQWLQIGSAMTSAEQYLDGSPIDRLVFAVLLALGLAVLATRTRDVGLLLRNNGAILLFFSYCALSILWSDFADVAFKRWTKALGDIVMVLVVLSDPDQRAAIRKFLTWTGFILVPLSVLFIKYYPDLGRGYLSWVWTPVYVGVTTNKNTLGVVTMLMGLASLWCFLQAFRRARGARQTKSMMVHCLILLMVVWTLWKANSATSWSCFLLGGGIMILTSKPAVARRPAIVHLLVAAALSVSFSTLFLDLGSGLVQTMGRDPTLTGRTAIWKLVLDMTGNPLFGTGFESFWLGPRLAKIWSLYWWHPNEAHNGYLEVFLNLGWSGVTLLAIILITAYRRVVAACRRDPQTGCIWLALFVVTAAYNLTEAAFRMLHPVWILFILAMMAAPEVSLRTKPMEVEEVPEFSPEVVPCTESV